ncbi:MAG TPA: 16S rRNA (uracil(1498)-N(3))-methyltransferase [Burkholderiaceae bacterium]|nr:16S rRNA (uracil(1498)-N(3))-methyltransferase [Burkholderiaceae bacterium]
MSEPAAHRLHHPGPLVAGTTVRLDAESSHHALRVLRLAPGDAIEVFDGGGLRCPGTLLDADARGASVALGAPREAGTESPLALGLAQGLPAGDKMDWVIEKAVELGVSVVQPLFARRSLTRLEGDRAVRRLAHWRRIAVAACMQCGRDRIPEIAEPLPLARWLAGPGADALPGRAPGAPGPARWMLSPRGTGALATLPAPAGGAWLLAGPESGLSEDEEARALAAGWTPLRLGPRTLRTETAGLAAIAALQARFGDF